MQAADLCYLPATELRRQYRSRSLSPVEVTRSILERIEARNPRLNAFVTATAERALEQAKVAERAYAGDAAPPPLCGIPVSIKDLTPTKGIRTARGSLLFENWVPDYDAPLVERLLDAGAVLLGKTNTPELGWKGDSGNRLFGPTHNPWKHGQTAGGSSGGAAAAIAAGMGPMAQGSDGAGSVRMPAGFCGIYGLKPSHGLVPQLPPSAVPPVSHIGPMTRTVADAALMLQTMAGSHIADPYTYDSGIDYTDAWQGGVEGLRVAWSPDLGYVKVDPEVAGIVAAAAARFEELGCTVEEAHPGLADPWDHMHVIWATAFAGVYLDNFAEVRGKLDPGLLAVVEQGRKISGPQVAAAYIAKNSYYMAWREFMADYDLLLTPTLPITAFAAGDDQPGEICGRKTTYLGWSAFTYPFNVTGVPAATVPCGRAANGLPVGLQIVGRWRDDTTVLRASAAFEALAPWEYDLPPDSAQGES